MVYLIPKLGPNAFLNAGCVLVELENDFSTRSLSILLSITTTLAFPSAINFLESLYANCSC